MATTTVGADRLAYELAQDFPKLPDGEEFAVVSTVATDSQDNLYVFQRKDPPVVVFDSDGNYLNAWGHGAFNSPHGMSVSDDVVYLPDRDDSVAVAYTLSGRPLMVLGERGVHSDTGCENPGDLVPRAAGPFNYPTEIVKGPSGALYVADGYRNSRIHKFTADGEFVRSWGTPETPSRRRTKIMQIAVRPLPVSKPLIPALTDTGRQYTISSISSGLRFIWRT